MTQEEKLKFHYLTNEILDGYSIIKDNKYGFLYIKHLDNKTSYVVNKEVLALTEKGKAKGLVNEKQRSKNLIELELWSEKKDLEIENTNLFLDGLRKSRSKVFLKKDIDFYSKEIKENEKKINELIAERKSIFGPTIESFIERKTNELYIFYSVFKDSEFKLAFVSREEFEEMDVLEIEEIYELYMRFSSDFSKINIQKMALLPSFLNLFFLCDNNPYVFFGAPIKNLTYNQLEIFNYGAAFKRILSENKDIFNEKYYDNPQELIDISEGREVAKEALDKQGGGRDNVSLVGATKEDYERLGLLKGAKLGSLSKTMKGRQTMNFEEIIKEENP